MINIDLPLIATAIGVIVSIWKFANSISKFGTSVDELRKAMAESQSDRQDLRKIVAKHDIELAVIKTQYSEIKTDLTEIKTEVKRSA